MLFQLIVISCHPLKGKLGAFLKEKTEEIPKMEAKILNLIEDKERMSNKKSHLVVLSNLLPALNGVNNCSKRSKLNRWS